MDTELPIVGRDDTDLRIAGELPLVRCCDESHVYEAASLAPRGHLRRKPVAGRGYEGSLSVAEATERAPSPDPDGA